MSADDSFQVFLGRIGESITEYMFLRGQYGVRRFGREVLDEADLDRGLTAKEKLRPDFKIEKNGATHLLEVTVSADGNLCEEKWDRIWAQRDIWPDVHILMILATTKASYRSKLTNPFNILRPVPEKEDYFGWVTLYAEDPSLYLSKMAILAGVKHWDYFMNQPMKRLHEW